MNKIKYVIKNNNAKGSVTVEATLCVTVFMLFALFLAGLFFNVYIQGEISHSIIQTSDSLCIEAYSLNALQTDVNTGIKVAITDLAVKIFNTANSDEYFYTDKRWFSEDLLLEEYVKEPEMSVIDPKNRRIDLAEIIKTRFIGYIANGDEEKADAFLEKMGVVDGIDGIDFSRSYVSSGKLYINADYKIKFLINIVNTGTIDVSQSYCSKIWK